jgi:hypothetical protein
LAGAIGDGRPGDVAAELLQFCTLIGAPTHRRMEAKALRVEALAAVAVTWSKMRLPFSRVTFVTPITAVHPSGACRVVSCGASTDPKAAVMSLGPFRRKVLGRDCFTSEARKQQQDAVASGSAEHEGFHRGHALPTRRRFERGNIESVLGGGHYVSVPEIPSVRL